MTNKYNPKSGIVSNIKIDSIQKFQATYYYKYELVQFCMANEIPYSGLMKFDLERNIITFLKGEVRFIKPKLRIKNWVQDKLGLGCEVTTNYKNNSQTRAFFVSVIGSKFRFSGAMMKYKEYNPELYITYQDLVNIWYKENENKKIGKQSTKKFYKANRYNTFVKQFFADQNNKGKTQKQMIEAWDVFKKSGKVNKL